jgi:DNA-binding winged helix-turn-helix (wHTH) protein/tetratricopeptide (TPR) repeat protein
VFRFAGLCLDERERRLSHAGGDLALTPRAFDLLNLLVTRAGQLVRRSEIFDALWPGVYVGDGTLTRHVSDLRKALQPVGAARLVCTVSKSGYRLDALVQCRDPAATPAPGAHSLAVLPLRALGAPGDAALELGLADTLIARLGLLADLIVRPVGAVRRYAGVDIDPLEAGRALGVDSVLSGSLQRAGERVRLTLHLLRVVDGRTLWARTFEETLRDVFAVQDNVAGQVARALLPMLAPQASSLPTSAQAIDPVAFEAYLRGRWFWGRRTQDDLRRALVEFERALAQDGRLAVAQAARADTLCLLAGYGLPLTAFDEAQSAAERALALDAGCADAHAVLGLIAQKRDCDWGRAHWQYRLALQLQPRHATALHRGGELLALLGRFDEGLALLRQARELDPGSAIVGCDVSKASFVARRYEDALRASDAVLAGDPTYARAHLYAGLAQLFLGRGAAARRALETAVTHDASDYACGMQAYVLGRLGAMPEATALRDRLEARAVRGFVTPYARVLAQLGLGAHDAALVGLEQMVNERHSVLGLGVSPLMDPLRAEPRFRRLLERAGLAGTLPAGDPMPAALR